jgi:hypothetical protein
MVSVARLAFASTRAIENAFRDALEKSDATTIRRIAAIDSILS